MMAGSISITEGTSAAFGFFGRTWRRAFVVLGLTGLLAAPTVAAILFRDLAMIVPLYSAHLLVIVMAQGALLRINQTEKDPLAPGPGWGGLQWGALEWRLLGVFALRVALFGVLGALLLVVMGALYIGAAAAVAGAGHSVAEVARTRGAVDPAVSAIVSIAALAGLVGLTWVAIRLYLAPAATAALGRVQLLSTWPVTRGHAWPILGSVVLVMAPLILSGLAIRAGRVLLSVRFAQHRTDAAILGLIIGLVHAFLVLPVSVGLMCYVYDRLRPDELGAG
jgi:hypothetical protein